MSRIRKCFIFGVFLLLFCFQIISIFLNPIHEDTESSFLPNDEESSLSLSSANIAIGVVICSQYAGSRQTEEASVMIKSAIISAQLYDVPKLDFHIFLEHRKDIEFFIENFKIWTNSTSNFKLQVYIHSVIRAVPEKYQNDMVFDRQFRCGYVRLFFSSALPHVDSILYLDTDTVITGSILDLWNHFGKMTKEQLIGVTRNNEPQNPFWKSVYTRWFADIPHPPPKGLNSGVLLMNLTRMRNYGFQERMLRLYEDYSKITTLNDQRLLNILLYFDQCLLFVLPCHFNFRFTHCEHELYCDDVLEDPKGIQLVHGAANYFDEGKGFHQIYLAYQDLNVSVRSNYENLKDELMKPLRILYTVESPLNVLIGNGKRYSGCYGSLDKLLFKNYF